MIALTPALLQRATACSPAAAQQYAQPLSDACAAYAIDTPQRLAAFLAQIGHESGSLRWVAEIWGPTAAQARYEGRADLGNTQPGDGFRYRGRGLIQTTGRHNYGELTRRLRARGWHCPDFEVYPDALLLPEWAVLSAADFWGRRGCNALADAGDFEALTRRINGGINGIDDRRRRLRIAQAALDEAAVLAELPPAPQAQDAPARGAEVATDQSDAPAQLEPSISAPKPSISAPAPPAPSRADLTPAEAGVVTTEDHNMLPFVAAALPALIEAAPALIRLFGASPAAERNARAAEAVAAVAREVTGQTTVEGAVQAIQADPAQAAAYREAVHQRLADLMQVMLQAHEADEASRTTAADRLVRLTSATGGVWLYLVGAVAAVIVLASYVIVTLVLLREGFSDETRALLLGQVVIVGFGTVVAFLFGSNMSNRVDQVQRQQERES